jgi:hypothetical protein
MLAFVEDSEEQLLGACFCAWKDTTQRLKYHRGTMMWLMERMALSQKGLVIQGVFRSWCHVAQQARQPAWALDLRRDVQTLLRDQAPEHEGGANVLMPSWFARTRGPLAILVLLLLLSLLWNVSVVLRLFISAPSGASLSSLEGAHVKIDTDGDGIEDRLDLCPSTPAIHGFRSTWHTDWDGDGCADTIEDTDDDNDLVPNSQDLCPRTLIADGRVDSEGCSVRQRRVLGDDSSGGSYAARLGDVALEVAVGMVLTAIVNFLWKTPSVTMRTSEIFSELRRICQEKWHEMFP